MSPWNTPYFTNRFRTPAQIEARMRAKQDRKYQGYLQKQARNIAAFKAQYPEAEEYHRQEADLDRFLAEQHAKYHPGEAYSSADFAGSTGYYGGVRKTRPKKSKSRKTRRQRRQ